MNRSVKMIASAALAGTCLLAGAAELNGHRFDDTVQVGGKSLQLNGLGLRSVFIVKAYVAALYVPERSREAAQLLGQTGPRRLALKMLATLPASQITKALVEGLQKNHTETQMLAFRPRIDQLTATLQAVGSVRKGEVIELDAIDGSLRISVGGQQRGEPIAGEDFYAAVLRIFLGEKPADRELKIGLLGGAARGE